MKYVKMKNTLTALCARKMQQNHGFFKFSPKHKHIYTNCLSRKALVIHLETVIFITINYGKHSLRYQGPHIWSKLDEN